MRRAPCHLTMRGSKPRAGFPLPVGAWSRAHFEFITFQQDTLRFFRSVLLVIHEATNLL